MTTQAQTGLLKLPDSGDANFTQLRAPATQAAPTTYTLPAVPASTGLTLTSTTVGVTSWAAAGGLTLAAVGASPNANGALLSSNTLALEPASASFPGVVTTGTQSFAGTKTFTGPLTLKDTGDANVVSLQAPSTQAGSTTYTLPTAPASTGLSLTSTTGGVMSWAAGTTSALSWLQGFNHVPGDGATINYTIPSGFTPTWCAASAVDVVGSAWSWSLGWCQSNMTQNCMLEAINAGSAAYTVVTFANLIHSAATGTVTSFSAGNISILWSNPSGNTAIYVLFAHA